ncbi:MAG: hypothetical protein AAB865_01385 [Patescibacteria group bacterium]
MLDIKIFFAITSIIALLIGYFPYLKDMFAKTTKPHTYTWLIWTITQGTATAAAFYGSANWGTLGLAGGTVFVIVIFSLSFKYGTKKITRSDTLILILALSAIVMWWLTRNPLLSVLMVAAIDGMGYIPTLRKSWEEPWSETLMFWLAMTVAIILTLLSLGEINWFTAPYLVVLATLNMSVLSVCGFRRRYIPKPV